MIATVFGGSGGNRAALRRARNLRAGERERMAGGASSPPKQRASLELQAAWLAGLLFILAGGALIAMHALSLADKASATPDASPFRQALPGESIEVPASPGVAMEQRPGGAVLALTSMHARPVVRVDLCTQMLDPSRPRLLPLRIGLKYDDVVRLVTRNDRTAGPAILRHVVLAAPGSRMPRLEIGGMATPGSPLTLRWEGGPPVTQWIGEASGGRIASGPRGQALLNRQGWLTWAGSDALRVTRRPSAACPQAGELLLQTFAAAAEPSAKSFVIAFPAQGEPVSAWLPPGRYRVPAAPAPSLEDQSLFERLQARGLLRLGPAGLIELAPSDLPAWSAAPSQARLDARWDGPPMDASTRALIDRLYRKADGAYLREQVRIFNAERRLLAWRVRADDVHGQWRASVDDTPAAVDDTMPGSAARLFDRLHEGWAPWSRIAAWPGAGNAHLTLALPHPANGGEQIRVMVAGLVMQVRGARIRERRAACSGHACPSPDAVQLLDLQLDAGARSVSLIVSPLDLAALALPGDEQYRHLRLADGHLEWHALPGRRSTVRPALAQVTLSDRNGTWLWHDGAPTTPARAAGLAPLLGLRLAHSNSIAGILARLPASTGAAHHARLTLDLALQAASQAALDCIGMRRGRWDGRSCTGGIAPPADRQAGLVVIDTQTGDVLAAASAGNANSDRMDWSELRAFDRADPARSPLRLPAFQHDGGAQRSPGSTFKLITALGLELAAQRDPRLEALLAGLPVASINRMARDNGFAFDAAAATYPANTRRAHVTNFREQAAERRAEDGQLGLAQAITYSLNTWFAWTGELSDSSLFGRPDGGVPGVLALEPGALAGVRPVVEMAQLLGFERALRMDGGLLPADFPWSPWDALQATPSHMDPIDTRHELRQMAIGLRMQVTPLQMALAAAAVGQGRQVAPRLLLELDGRAAFTEAGPALGVRLDRIRAGMKGVIDKGTAAGAFRGHEFDTLRPGLYGKTGTAPTGAVDAAGRSLATVWFTGWIEPGSLPGQTHRLAVAAFVSHSVATGGEHAAPVVAAVLKTMQIKEPSKELE